MKQRRVFARDFDIDRLIIEDLVAEENGHRMKFKYQYPDGMIETCVIAYDFMPITYGITKYQKAGQVVRPGMDMCLGPRGIRRNPDDPSKFILPSEDKMFKHAEVAFKLSDQVEEKIRRFFREKKKREVTFPHPGVRGQNQPMDEKKAKPESQTFHTHLGYEVTNKETGEWKTTTTFEDRYEQPVEYEQIRKRSREAMVAPHICLASAFIKSTMEVTVKWNVNHAIVCKWGTDPSVMPKRQYDRVGLDLGDDDMGSYDRSGEQQEEEVEDKSAKRFRTITPEEEEALRQVEELNA
jgi:hypothetical protein